MTANSPHPPDPTEKPPIDVAIGIVIDLSRVLICQRRATTVLGGYWEFPGGKVERDESIEAAVVRELREELGITVTPIESLDPIVHVYPHATVRLHPFLCTLVDGVPQAIDCVAWKWIAPNELNDYRFPEANGPLLQAVLSHPRTTRIKD